MGFFDNIKEEVDEAKDKVEEETGIDIDRDGSTGKEDEPSNEIDTGKPPSKDTIAPNRPDNDDSSNSDSNDSSPDIDVDSGGGSSDSSSKSSSNSSGSNSPSKDTIAPNIDNNKDSSGSSSSSSSENSNKSRNNREPAQGLETIANENRIAQKEPENLTEQDVETLQERNERDPLSNVAPGQEESQDLLDQRQQEFDAVNNIQKTRRRINDAPENAEIKTVSGETITVERANKILDEAENEVKAQGSQTIYQLNKLENQYPQNNPLAADNQFEETVESTANLGIELSNTVRPNQDANVGNAFNDFSRDIRDSGVEIMNQGDQLGNTVSETLPEPGAFVLEETGQITGIDQLETAGEFSRNASNALQSGAGTLGTQIVGLGVGGAGGLGLLAQDATNKPVQAASDLAQGSVDYYGAFFDELSNNPVDTVGQELGEEAVETGIGLALFGGAGAAAGATPTISPNIRPEIDLTSTRRGSATMTGGTRVGPETTPELFDVEPRPPQPETPAIEGPKDPLSFDNTGSVNTDTGTVNQQSIDSPAATPILDGFNEVQSKAPSTPETVTQATPESINSPMIEAFFNAEANSTPDTRATPQAETTPLLDFRPETNVRAEPTPNSSRTPNLTDSGADAFLEDLQEQSRSGETNQNGEFAPSLTAGLFNIVADDNFDQEQTFTGTEIRPLIEDEL